MARAKQLALSGFEGLGARRFGGSELKGNPREARPISLRRPMHLVIRSTLATGPRSFLTATRAREIQSLVYTTGHRKGVRIYRYANSGNHLHLIVMPKSRAAYHAFIRTLTGVIARITLGKERGRARAGSSGPTRTGGAAPGASDGPNRFWDARPFTRILTWGREFRGVVNYLLRNRLEAAGFGESLPPRKKKPPDN